MVLPAVLFWLLLVRRVVADSGRHWTPVFLEEYPLAVCNDGSPAAFYFRPGKEGTRRWLVYLDGAGWWWDADSCAHGWQKVHGTSNKFPRTMMELLPKATRFLRWGLFDMTRSPLADAHVAFVKSCSNDAFMGDRAPLMAYDPIAQPFSHRNVTAWHFRGRRIVEAVFLELRKRTGLGERMGDRVIYGGCSAGARGALATMDYFATNTQFVGQAGVLGLLDSGMWVPIAPRHRTQATDWDSFAHQMKQSMNLINATVLLGEGCRQSYPGEESWKCMMGAFRLPFVRTPYFMVHSQYDLFAVSMNLWGRYMVARKFTQGDLMWAETYRRTIVRYLPIPQAGSGTVVFSPACYFHCILTVPRFWMTTANNSGLAATLNQWLNSPLQPDGRIYDTCIGFNCGFHEQIRPYRRLSGTPQTNGLPGELAEPTVPSHSMEMRPQMNILV
jgi:hypothetical protein